MPRREWIGYTGTPGTAINCIGCISTAGGQSLPGHVYQDALTKRLLYKLMVHAERLHLRPVDWLTGGGGRAKTCDVSIQGDEQGDGLLTMETGRVLVARGETSTRERRRRHCWAKVGRKKKIIRTKVERKHLNFMEWIRIYRSARE